MTDKQRSAGPESGPAIQWGSDREGRVTKLAFSPDGKTLACADADGLIRFYDPTTARERSRLNLGSGRQRDAIRSLKYLPDGSTLAVSLGVDDLILWDLLAGKEKVVLKSPGDQQELLRWVTSLSTSTDDHRLAAGWGYGSITVWQIPENLVIAHFRAHWEPERLVGPGRRIPEHGVHVMDLEFVNGGKEIVSIGADGFMRFWEISSRRECCEPVKLGNNESCDFSPDRTEVAIGSADGVIHVRETSKGRERVVLRGHSRSVRSLSYLPGGGALISIGEDQTLRLWDVAGGFEIALLKLRSKQLLDQLAVSPDGRTIAAGGFAGSHSLGVVELIETDGKTLKFREFRH